MGFISGEIQYNTTKGMVHSDIDIADSKDNRKFLHDLLDEWLDKGNGTGGIYFGECIYFPETAQDIVDVVVEMKRRGTL